MLLKNVLEGRIRREGRWGRRVERLLHVRRRRRHVCERHVGYVRERHVRELTFHRQRLQKNKSNCLHQLAD